MKPAVFKYPACGALGLLSLIGGCAQGVESVQSTHLGVLYPNGVDVAGYTVERRIDAGLYRFYTFGFPALAAMGIGYYRNFAEDGLTSTVGVGVGSVLYGSVAYQWRVGKARYVKLGAGVTFGVAYGGAYPVISYEYRFGR